MKKLIILSIVTAVAAGSAFGQSAKKTAEPTTIACAVMSSNQVNIAKATKSHMFADYKGKRYFFCCGGCPAEFKASPAKYAKSASIPTPGKMKPAKKA